MVTEPSQTIEARFRVSRIIHAAMVLSLVMYAVVVHLMQALIAWQGANPGIAALAQLQTRLIVLLAASEVPAVPVRE